MHKLALTGLAVASLCGCRPDGDSLVEHRLYAMATTVELTLPATATIEHPELIAAIEGELHSFERDYYAWGDGELARLNRALTETGKFEPTADMLAVLAAAQHVAQISEGAFDPGVGGLVELYGFNDATRELSTPPSEAAIATTLASAGSILDLDLDLGAHRVTAPARRYLLDLGGIAKGTAVDRIVARLGGLGIEPAIVNAGGDLRVVGERRTRAWRIGIQAPRGDGLLGAIELHAGEAAFSSGDYERFYEADGQRLHHIIDPRTGHPVAHTEAITVIARDGVTADAAATALFVAGPERWLAVAAALGIESALRVDASGQITMTAPMRDRFQASAGVDTAIIVAGH